MSRNLVKLFILICLSGCGQPEAPTWEQQAAGVRTNEIALEAMQDADFVRTQQDLTQARAAQDAAEQRDAARFAIKVLTQQAARAKLLPAMQACLVLKGRALATKSAASAVSVADAIMKDCRPFIDAVARTVELAGVSSAGLTADISARFRPRVIAIIESVRDTSEMHRGRADPSGNARQTSDPAIWSPCCS